MADARTPLLLGELRDPVVDERGCLVDDLACRRCGYSLRGLKSDGLCPECTTPVGRSIHGDLLQFSDPDWVTRIARGGNLVAWSIVLMLIVPLAVSMIVSMKVMAIPDIGFALPKALQVLGFWMATSPDPAANESESHWSARRMARWGSVFAGGLSIAAQVVNGNSAASLVTILPGAPMGSPAAQAMAILLVAAVNTSATVALLVYAGQLAARLPDDKLRRQTNGVSLWFLIAASVHALLGGYAALKGVSFRGGIGSLPLATVDSVARLVQAICAIWCIVLIFKFKDRLITTAKLSRETWARPVAASSHEPTA